jgi:DNA-binding NarL/FixJ family response regulator
VIRVLVAARRPTARAGLVAVLRLAGDLEVVGEVANAGDLLAVAPALTPEVVLVELESAEEKLAAATISLARDTPGLMVVVVADADRAWIAGAIRRGIRGVLEREVDSAAIIAAIHAAAQNLLVLPPAMAQGLLTPESLGHATTTPASPSMPEFLTPREVEVLRLVSEGLGNKGIAQRLKISDHTVKFHVAAAMTKLGAASRAEAVATAVRRGLILL